MTPTAAEFVERLNAHATPVDVARAQDWFRTDATFIGVRMGTVFQLAKEFVTMEPAEIDKLFDSPVHEVRVGAVSILGKQFTAKRTSDERRGELFELFMSRLDRINTWDLVDVSSHHVVGGYLLDKPRDVLYELARSERWWERRIAMFSTLTFIRRGDLDDCFALAELLVDDEHDLVQKVVGGVLREAGKHEVARLRDFLDRHAATAPRIVVRYASEHLAKPERERYLAAGRR